MAKEIRIECEGSKTIRHDELVPMQGNLKSLAKEDYERLRDEIVADGFSEPISAWDDGGIFRVLNGHQRLRTIKEMCDNEGYDCPPIPISVVQARDEKQARRKLLSMASAFGKVEKEGLYEFMQESNLELDDVISSFRLPEIDMEKFAEEFYLDPLSDDPADISLSLPPVGDPLKDGDNNSNHVRMVQLFLNEENQPSFIRKCQEIYKVLSEADAVVTHNGKRFDWKFLQTRLIKHKLKPMSKTPHIDTCVSLHVQTYLQLIIVCKLYQN